MIHNILPLAFALNHTIAHVQNAIGVACQRLIVGDDDKSLLHLIAQLEK